MLCSLSVIGLCDILCILQHFRGRFFRTRCSYSVNVV